MEEAIRTRLLTLPALSALVGTRIDWGSRGQGQALPAIALHIAAASPTMNLARPGAWVKALIWADCWGRTYAQAKAIADLVAALPGEGGLHGLRATLGTTKIRSWVLDRSTDTDTDTTGTIHRTRLALRVWHQL